MDCWLMQILHVIPPVDLFSDYVYFSSFSEHMLMHSKGAAKRYIKEFGLNKESLVVEVASNDGYLLKNFVASDIPCLGIEPAANIAEVARRSGVDTRADFFGTTSAQEVLTERGYADLILGNNVFAHVPDVNDFVAGLRILISQEGVIILEFPYGVEMIERIEFDTIYHEHVFYFTLTPLIPLFEKHGLEIFHVEKIQIHGGSLRVFAGLDGKQICRPSVDEILDAERSAGVETLPYYQTFAAGADQVKNGLLEFLAAQKLANKRVAAYGASAKGSTLLNFIGDAAADLEFIADRSVYKHGKLSPGIHIPIVPAEDLEREGPDFAILLVWNFAEEVMHQQMAYQRKGGRFVIPLPVLSISSTPNE